MTINWSLVAAYPAVHDLVRSSSPLIAAASQPSDNCARSAVGRMLSQGRAANPNF
jgi:hypothetical protein